MTNRDNKGLQSIYQTFQNPKSCGNQAFFVPNLLRQQNDNLSFLLRVKITTFHCRNSYVTDYGILYQNTLSRDTEY